MPCQKFYHVTEVVAFQLGFRVCVREKENWSKKVIFGKAAHYFERPLRKVSARVPICFLRY